MGLLRSKSVGGESMIAMKLLSRLLVAVSLWLLLVAACFLQPRSLGYAGVALLHLWYFYIPFLLAIVSVAWFIVRRSARSRG